MPKLMNSRAVPALKRLYGTHRPRHPPRWPWPGGAPALRIWGNPSDRVNRPGIVLAGAPPPPQKTVRRRNCCRRKGPSERPLRKLAGCDASNSRSTGYTKSPMSDTLQPSPLTFNTHKPSSSVSGSPLSGFNTSKRIPCRSRRCQRRQSLQHRYAIPRLASLLPTST